MTSLEPSGIKSVANVALRFVSDDDKAWFQKGEYKRVVKNILNRLFYDYDILDAKNSRAAREQQFPLPTEIKRTIIPDLFMKSPKVR